MGTWTHRLSDIDTVKGTGTCSVCGVLALKTRVRNGTTKYSCPVSESRYNRNRGPRAAKKPTGMSVTEYKRLKKLQRNRCRICGKTAKENGRALAGDHCHATMKARGLLCSSCNMGLGYFRDDPELMRKAALYLER